jgi:hypothetical protein
VLEKNARKIDTLFSLKLSEKREVFLFSQTLKPSCFYAVAYAKPPLALEGFLKKDDDSKLERKYEETRQSLCSVFSHLQRSFSGITLGQIPVFATRSQAQERSADHTGYNTG